MDQDIRKIIHVDMDAFYASVEQRDNPNLKGLPVAVGGSSKRGVVAAASYEARSYGVYSAMSSVIAKRKCPNLIFVKPRFDHYRNISREIRAIFNEYTDQIEPLSLDEAYLDVTHNKMKIPSATLIAKAIKASINTKTELTASAGISFNKFLAKTASALDKPNGLSVILPKQAEDFVAKLPIHKFHGIGKVTAEKMNNIGIFFGSDLRKFKENDLISRFGKVGTYYYNIARGIDHRIVNPNRERKSISSEDTFENDLTNLAELQVQLKLLCSNVFGWMDKYQKYGKTITVKVKYGTFKVITRSKTLPHDITTLDTMMEMSDEILKNIPDINLGIRLLGVGISNFSQEIKNTDGIQLTIDF